MSVEDEVKNLEDRVPESFLCPISGDVMLDPVFDGAKFAFRCVVHVFRSFMHVVFSSLRLDLKLLFFSLFSLSYYSIRSHVRARLHRGGTHLSVYCV